MRILLVEPFFGGSHRSWAEGLRASSRHDIDLLTLPGRHWKWRMHGAAVTLSRAYTDRTQDYDLILASDMLDVAVFKGLAACRIPIATYFHENQLAYPWSPQDRDVQKGRDFHYGFINWTTALASNKILFNSSYNLNSFYEGVERMLRAMPDHRSADLISECREKSEVLPLAMHLSDIRAGRSNKSDHIPVILWNHRWEYDKDPETFFDTLQKVRDKGIAFKLIVCGESYERYPAVFDDVANRFSQELIHIGYAEDRKTYVELLGQADILPVTNKQEFFGHSVMEAMTAECFPLLPNRLSYRELIPESLHQSILYKDVSDLEHRLTEILKSPDSIGPFRTTVRDIALRYDWPAMIDEYDDILESVIS